MFNFFTPDERICVMVIASHPREAFAKVLAWLERPRSCVIDGVRRHFETDVDTSRCVPSMITENMRPMATAMRNGDCVCVVIYNSERVATNVLVSDDHALAREVQARRN